MSNEEKERRVRFLKDLHELVAYHGKEYYISYFEVCGALKIYSDHLSKQARESGNDKDKGEFGYGGGLDELT